MMDNHEYLEQKLGKVHTTRDLEEHYDYLVEQVEWMQKHWAEVFHNSLTGETRVCAFTEEHNLGAIQDYGYCLLHALDNLKTKIGENYAK